jgi:cytochrome c oxidase subunit 4
MEHAVENAHHAGSGRFFLLIWFWLLAITAIEVVLTYQQLSVVIMLVLLMGLSVIKAFLIIAYFMHLRYERLSLAVTLIPPLVIVICLLFLAFPDSIRLLNLRPR